MLSSPSVAHRKWVQKIATTTIIGARAEAGASRTDGRTHGRQLKGAHAGSLSWFPCPSCIVDIRSGPPLLEYPDDRYIDVPLYRSTRVFRRNLSQHGPVQARFAQ